jgi:hypothetical protein
MTFPILGGNGAVAGYSIDNSLRFNDGDSPYLSRSLSSTSTTWTFSTWVKRGELSANNYLISWGNSGTDGTAIGFDSGDNFFYYSEDGGSNRLRETSAVYRDTSAFYHLICQCSSNAITLYVNGEEPTQSWVVGSSANPLDTSTMNIGKWVTSTHYYDGYMAETYFIEGQALSPTDFGEFDEDSGIWKPIEYTGTYGTNGFYLDFSNSSDFGEDFSGNDNDFTATNLASTDQTTDTPTNNFAVLNVLQARATYGMPTLSEGNLQFGGAGFSTSWGYRGSTIEMPSGKWYCEVKCSGNSYAVIGVFNTGYYGESHFLDQNPQNNTGSWGIYHDGATNTQKILNGSASSASVAEFNDDDIVGAVPPVNLNTELNVAVLEPVLS